MHYRRFGKTGWKVSQIGFGGWQLGGTWGEVDDRESIDTLLYAFEKGINFVDTAMLYGAGRSERVIGRALRERNSVDSIYVATKVPPVVWNQQNQMDAPMRGRYPSLYLREQVEQSLVRLGVEAIDLLQLHGWFHRGVEELDWLEGLHRLKLEGKVRHIGVSLHDARPEQGVALAKLGLVDSIQVLFNLFEQEPLETLIPVAEDSDTAIIARVPFDSGALTGTWTQETMQAWHEEDKRYQMYAKDGNFSDTLKRIEALQGTLASSYENLAEAALQYVLHPAGVATVIPGMRNKREVALNLACATGKAWPSSMNAAIKPHNWKHAFY